MNDLPSFLMDNYGLRPQGKAAPMSSAKKGVPDVSPLREGNPTSWQGAPAARTPPTYSSTPGLQRSPPVSNNSTMGTSSDAFSDGFFGMPSRSTNHSGNLDGDIFSAVPGFTPSPSIPTSSPFGNEDVFKVQSNRTAAGTASRGMMSGGPSGGIGGNSKPMGGKSSYSASAAAFDDLLGYGSLDLGGMQTAGRSKAAVPPPPARAASEDLLGGFSSPVPSKPTAPSRRGPTEMPIPPPPAPAPSADPFGFSSTLDPLDPLFGASPTPSAPPPAPESSDPFGDPFFVASTPPDVRAAPSAPPPPVKDAVVDDTSSVLDEFAKFAASASSGRRSPQVNRETSGKDSVTDNGVFSSDSLSSSQKHRDSSLSRDESSGGGSTGEGRRPQASASKLGHSASDPRLPSQDAPRSQMPPSAPFVDEEEIPAGSSGRRHAAVPPRESRMEDEVWLTVDDVILRTEPLATPPPNRPPPPVGKEGYTPPLPVYEPPELPSEWDQHKPTFVASEVGKAPTPESASGGLNGFEDFASANAAAAPQGRRPSVPESADTGNTGMDGFDDFASGVGSGKTERGAENARVDRRADEAQGRPGSADLNASMEAAEQSTAAMREALERAKMKADAARQAREREREREKQEQEAAAREAEIRTKSRAGEELRARAEAEARAKREARLQAEAQAKGQAQAEAQAQAHAEAQARAKAQERAQAQAAQAQAKAQAQAQANAQAQAQAQAQAKAKAQAQAQAQAAQQARSQANDLDAFFSGTAAKPPPDVRQRAPDRGPVNLDDLGGRPKPAPAAPKAAAPAPGTSSADSWADILGGGSTPVAAVNHAAMPGESEDRRKARIARETRVAERSAKALDEKYKRDEDLARERAERDRAGDMLDIEIKKWALGKQGNLRALLSSLHYVLWPECQWEPIAIPDLITANAVKKAYRKATLCVHPDKVQQKGATVQQKYIAEKVFDLLKEAWTKFNSEELF